MILQDLKLFFSNEIIEFYCHQDSVGTLPEPIPAYKNIPEWWRKLAPTDPKEKDMFGSPGFTAKKCMPLLDVHSLGYIIPLQGDIGVKTNIDRSIIKIHNPPGLKIAEFHSKGQLGGFGGADAVKFINRWIIKTAPGWSTLFIPPINAFNPHFTCLGGLVDTDKYPKEVNFPAIWHTGNFDDMLRAGTPLVTAIPIKRNSFPKTPKIRKITEKEIKVIAIMEKIQNSRASYYSNELREPRK